MSMGADVDVVAFGLCLMIWILIVLVLCVVVLHWQLALTPELKWYLAVWRVHEQFSNSGVAS